MLSDPTRFLLFAMLLFLFFCLVFFQAEKCQQDLGRRIRTVAVDLCLLQCSACVQYVAPVGHGPTPFKDSFIRNKKENEWMEG